MFQLSVSEANSFGRELITQITMRYRKQIALTQEDYEYDQMIYLCSMLD